MISTQNMILDLWQMQSEDNVFTIHTKQGDDGARFLRVMLVEGGKHYLPPEGTSAVFRCVKPDGTSCINPAIIDAEGAVVAELTEQVLAVPGMVHADISLRGDDGEVLSAASFQIFVVGAPLGQEIPSSNEFLELMEMIRRGYEAIRDVENLPSPEDGKSAYEYAKEGGYTGTEAEFAELLAQIGVHNSVSSVNGKTGVVVLTAEDVGAEHSGAALAATKTHNNNLSAHGDIRMLIEQLSERLNTLANSTDIDLDQMAELVAYIKDNRELIDQVTTGKVSVSDIVNNLTTKATNKPLSAAQGLVIKALIDGLQLSKLDADTLSDAVNNALAQAKTSGEFDGADGKTPVKGVDYYTDADKAEMVSAVITALPVYNGEVVSV